MTEEERIEAVAETLIKCAANTIEELSAAVTDAAADIPSSDMPAIESEARNIAIDIAKKLMSAKDLYPRRVMQLAVRAVVMALIRDETNKLRSVPGYAVAAWLARSCFEAAINDSPASPDTEAENDDATNYTIQ